jgi:hypothetical protein
MTVISDINQMWPEAVIDIGPIQLTRHYWGIVGSIPYDGHVVLAVSPTPPNWRGPTGLEPGGFVEVPAAAHEVAAETRTTGEDNQPTPPSPWPMASG